MTKRLQISIGQHTATGPKPINQDFHGLQIPGPGDTKGIIAAIADGISSSAVSHIAAESAVKSFLTDFSATPDAWSTKRSGERVFSAINAWLHGQTQAGQGRFNKDLGYISTLSVLVLRSQTAHVFHAGDTRIYRIEGQSLEQLTTDHRLAISAEESYLSRALGLEATVDVEYRKLPITVGDLFILSTDGVHDFWDKQTVPALIRSHGDDLNRAAQKLVELSLAAGSQDNLSIQLIRVDELPEIDASERHDPIDTLAPLRELKAGQLIDGYRILRPLYSSHRSHLYLAEDSRDGAALVIKIPATDQQSDQLALERLLNEEWIARRVNNPHLLKAYPQAEKRSALYIALEYLKGQTLAQWLRDHPRPNLESVRLLIEQIGLGLQALHRMEMVHQDVRPDNIMIDHHGTLKIIDFGSTISGATIEAYEEDGQEPPPLGTEQFSAPEVILGYPASAQSDIFSLGVVTYFMLSGHLPYGAQVARLRQTESLKRLTYVPLAQHKVDVPLWVEAALKKALHPVAHKRYSEVGEFIWDLRHPNPDFGGLRPPPLVERNPVLVWQLISAGLLVLLVLSLHWGTGPH